MAPRRTPIDRRTLKATEHVSAADADRTLEALNRPAEPAKPLSTLPRRISGEAALPATPGAYEGLPALMAEVASVTTLDTAFCLFEARGGNRVYIPASAGDDHWLVKLVGRDQADKLIAHFVANGTGLELDLPRGPTGGRADTWRRLYKMLAEGRSSSEITRNLGISRDTVKYHRALLRNRVDGRQLDMIDWINRDEPALPEPPKKLAKGT